MIGNTKVLNWIVFLLEAAFLLGSRMIGNFEKDGLGSLELKLLSY